MSSLLPDPLPPFSSLVYTRPDVRRFSEEARRTKNHYQKWNKARNLREASQRFQDEVDAFDQAATLAQIRLLLNPGDPVFREECQFFETVLPSVDRLVDSVTGWLRQKTSSPELKDFFGSSFLRKTQTAHLPYQKAAIEVWEAEQEAWQQFLLAGERARLDSAAEDALLEAYFAWILCRRRLSQEWGFSDVLEECLARRSGKELHVTAIRRLRTGIRDYFSRLSFLPFPEENGNDQWSLEFPDWIYGLNTLCNALGLEEDWLLHLERAGYITVTHPVTDQEKIHCFFLPQSRLPYVLAQIPSTQKGLYALLGETGRSYAYLRAAQQFSFTPFVEWDWGGGQWVSQSFILAAWSQMRIFMGSKASAFQEWAGVYFVRELLQTACLDAFQDRVFSEAQKPEDVWTLWDACSQDFFPSDSLQQRRSRLYESFQEVLLLREPFATTELLLAQISALSFWDICQTQPVEALVAWDLFCQGGSRDTLMQRIHAIGLPSPLEPDTLKRLAYQLCYTLGY